MSPLDPPKPYDPPTRPGCGSRAARWVLAAAVVLAAGPGLVWLICDAIPDGGPPVRFSSFLRDLAGRGPWETGTLFVPPAANRWACTACEVTWAGDDTTVCGCCNAPGVRWESQAPDGWPKLTVPVDWAPEDLL